MRCGLIDIGSNTIRAVIYDVGETTYQEVLNEKEYAEIISYVEDDELTAEGIEKLVATLDHMQNLCQMLHCQETHFFATSSLRNITNKEAVVREVEAETGISIELLSGCAEAYYDYVGLREAIKVDEALGFDLGGGSGQVFYYQNNELVKSASYSIGCLRLYNSCVSGVFPNAKERSAIEKMVRGHLKETGAFSEKRQEIIYGMGGTARACMKLHKKLLGVDKTGDNYMLSLEDLKELDEVVTSMGLGGIKILNRIMPERLCTIIPGLIAIRTIMKHTGAKKLCIVKQGVREGYLLANVIRRKEGTSDEQRTYQYLCQP